MLEIVPNVSEGRNPLVLERLIASCVKSLIDIHSDEDHNRSVLTLSGHSPEVDLRQLSRSVAETIDLRQHQGVHPRLGALDVVPFVALDGENEKDLDTAIESFGTFLWDELRVPVFRYGGRISLPEVRRRAFIDLSPTWGSGPPHDRLGSTVLGQRDLLVAYNVILHNATRTEVARLAKILRSPNLRTLTLEVRNAIQLSTNLINPLHYGPIDLYREITSLGYEIERCELVGLIPQAVLDRTEPAMQTMLDLDVTKTIEWRVEYLGNPRASSTQR